MWVVSIACLLFVMVLCVLGTVVRAFRDNLPQRIGMAFLFIGCWPRVQDMWLYRPESDGSWLGHLGLAMFALGTAWKVWKHRHVDPHPPAPPHRVHHDDLRHVRGGKG